MTKNTLKVWEFVAIGFAVVGGVMAITGYRFANGSYNQREMSGELLGLGVVAFAAGFVGLLVIRSVAALKAK